MMTWTSTRQQQSAAWHSWQQSRETTGQQSSATKHRPLSQQQSQQAVVDSAAQPSQQTLLRPTPNTSPADTQLLLPWRLLPVAAVAAVWRRLLGGHRGLLAVVVMVAVGLW